MGGDSSVSKTTAQAYRPARQIVFDELVKFSTDTRMRMLLYRRSAFAACTPGAGAPHTGYHLEMRCVVTEASFAGEPPRPRHAV